MSPEERHHYRHNITNHTIHENDEITPYVGFSEGGYVIGDALWDGETFSGQHKFSDMLDHHLGGSLGAHGVLTGEGGLILHLFSRYLKLKSLQIRHDFSFEKPHS